ncbi:MAG: methionyl-tRNA formyltransferase [Candidatus Nealsonbacteria bacterium RBG_13_36_15]|uniref:Methionyl-tRNA formyltransferase n=1 Tax=Candidatus Nealsonbacteria bacterium RBG_13_36_15 TaxID=1801660 RepID=A0A1G2DV68_9BACT|nr:MAG: methionyl-tRNA formyltransferase [Candidatus Nealsonbacteria bacterium RBG_13_36_15]
MKNNTNINIIFMGVPEFGTIILEKLIENNLKPVLVVTAPDKPVGRKQILTPPPVKVIAEKHGISVLQPEKPSTIQNLLSAISPDLIAVAAYGKILPKEILEMPKYGCLNVHPSLLPRWRGASPIQFTILAGDQETGVTIILIDEKMDHGPILASAKYQIQNDKITYKELDKNLADLGAELLIKTLPKWTNREIEPIPQDELKTTFTKVLKKEDGRINWGKSAGEIERQIRAFNPWPGSYCFWPKGKNNLRLKILRATIQPQKKEGPFGIRGKTFLAPNNRIALQTKKDFLIIEELQLEGKKPQSTEEFLMGRSDFIGTILE